MLPFARPMPKDSTRPRPLREARITGPTDEPAPAASSASEVAVFLIDAAGIITAWTPSAASISCYTSAEIVGTAIAVLFTLEAGSDGHPAGDLASAIPGGRVEEQGWLVRKDGQRVWVEIVINSFRDGTGKITGFACQTRDLSVQKSAEV